MLISAHIRPVPAPSHPCPWLGLWAGQACGHLQTCPQADPGQLGGLLASDEQVSPVNLPFPMSQVGMKRVPPPKAVVVRQRDLTRPRRAASRWKSAGNLRSGKEKRSPSPPHRRTRPLAMVWDWRGERREGRGLVPGIAQGRRRGPITSQMLARTGALDFRIHSFIPSFIPSSIHSLTHQRMPGTPDLGHPCPKQACGSAGLTSFPQAESLLCLPPYSALTLK